MEPDQLSTSYTGTFYTVQHATRNMRFCKVFFKYALKQSKHVTESEYWWHHWYHHGCNSLHVSLRTESSRMMQAFTAMEGNSSIFCKNVLMFHVPLDTVFSTGCSKISTTIKRIPPYQYAYTHFIKTVQTSYHQGAIQFTSLTNISHACHKPYLLMWWPCKHGGVGDLPQQLTSRL